MGNIRQQAMLCIVALRCLSCPYPSERLVSGAENICVGREGKVWGLNFWPVGGRAPVAATLSACILGWRGGSPIVLLGAY